MHGVPTDPASAPLSVYTHQEYLGRGYVGELDGIRGLAVVLVIACHIKRDPFHFVSGHLGVTLFFVLSGYLITAIALREERSRGGVSLPAFYIRRTFRIFPLYFLTLACYAVLLLKFHYRAEQEQLLRRYWPAYFLYYQEFVREWTDGRMPFVHSWSLGIEEKFYLVWPVVCFLGLRTLPARSWLAGIGAVALTLIAAILKEMQYSGLGRCLDPYAGILCGCLLALVLDGGRGYSAVARRLGGRTPLFLTGVFIAAQLLAAPARDHQVNELIYRTMYTVVAVCWFASLITGDGWVQQLLRSRPMAFLGRMSYGMYLIHLFALPPMNWITARLPSAAAGAMVALVGGTALTALIAYVLSRAVEQPFVRLGRRLSGAVLSRSPSARIAPAHAPSHGGL